MVSTEYIQVIPQSEGKLWAWVCLNERTRLNQGAPKCGVEGGRGEKERIKETEIRKSRGGSNGEVGSGKGEDITGIE